MPRASHRIVAKDLSDGWSPLARESWVNLMDLIGGGEQVTGGTDEAVEDSARRAGQITPDLAARRYKRYRLKALISGSHVSSLKEAIAVTAAY